MTMIVRDRTCIVMNIVMEMIHITKNRKMRLPEQVSSKHHWVLMTTTMTIMMMNMLRRLTAKKMGTIMEMSVHLAKAAGNNRLKMLALTITEDWASIIQAKIWARRADQLTRQVSIHLMQLVCHQSSNVESLHIAQALTMISTTERKATGMTLKDPCITRIDKAQISTATIKTLDLSTNSNKTPTEGKIIDLKRT